MGFFHELKNNVKLLHEIYLDLETKPDLNTTNDLYNDIVNGVGTSGKHWNIPEIGKGIFTESETYTIQQILNTKESFKKQWEYLNSYLWNPLNLWQTLDIFEMTCDYQAKCLLATYILWKPEVISWVNGASSQPENLYDMAEFLVSIRIDDKNRIEKMVAYIEENLSNEELRDF